MEDHARIDSVDVCAYTVPTDAPESDGTLEWTSTTLVVARVAAAGTQGIGYTYADTACATLIREKLAPLLIGRDALDISARYTDVVRALRNLGRAGIGGMALSALDVALWDLKAKRLGVSLGLLLAPARRSIRAYGSGGFTSYSRERLREQLSGWAREGLTAVKMKVGRDARADVQRVTDAREAIGPGVELFVDANGAYPQEVALRQAEAFGARDVHWFEEPVSSDDLDGLRGLRERRPGGMAIAAGEYGYDTMYFRRMLAAGAIDTLQADATRCGGVTGFLDAAALADAFGVPLSSHCAPSLHVPLCCAARRAIHLEYFHDHVRIESMLFDGAPVPGDGMLAFDTTRPGLGLELRERDAACYRR